MTTTTAHGTSFKCISSLELQEVRDWALDAFGSERLLTDQRLIRLLDALEAAQHHIEVIEDAARIRASAPSLLPMMAEMFPSRAVANHAADSQCHALGGESEDEPARLQKIGAI